MKSGTPFTLKKEDRNKSLYAHVSILLLRRIKPARAGKPVFRQLSVRLSYSDIRSAASAGTIAVAIVVCCSAYVSAVVFAAAAVPEDDQKNDDPAAAVIVVVCTK